MELDAIASKIVVDFIAWGIKLHAYTATETIYQTNRLLRLLDVDGIDLQVVGDTTTALATLTDGLMTISAHDGDGYRAELLDIVTPTPDRLQTEFNRLYLLDPEQAIAYFYELSRLVENIKVREVARNRQFIYASEFGDLEITINLSKPEKTTAEIKAAANLPKTSYPPTALDVTNEGYRGNGRIAPRQTHRFIRTNLGDEQWGWHYSPYAYFAEHAIFVNFTRQMMRINGQTFQKLVQLVQKYPAYVVGSNADLPIVGGSILSQEHFQGGRHEFPMLKAAECYQFNLPTFASVQASVLHWPMTVIKLRSQDEQKIVQASEYIRDSWSSYSDETLSIYAYGPDRQAQHTVTPIIRYYDNEYQMYIVLRDNGVSPEFPDGIFHPHQDVQHIKRENIGLIEVMGLAILPGRLQTELAIVADYLTDQALLSQVAETHQEWAQTIKATFAQQTVYGSADFVDNAVGEVFARVLLDAGVYKLDMAGQAGLQRFIKHLQVQ